MFDYPFPQSDAALPQTDALGTQPGAVIPQPDASGAQISGDGVEIEQVLVVRQRVVLPSVVTGAADAGACGDGRLPRESLASDIKVRRCHKDATAHSQSRNLRNQVASVTQSLIAPREPYPVALTREMQRTDELLQAIADWRVSTGAERGRDRRYAMRLLAAERKRRDARRAALHAATRRAA